MDTPFSWRVGYRMRSSSIVTLGANVHIESNLAGWGDSVGELFLGRVGRPALHFAGRAAGPGRVDALWVCGGDALYAYTPCGVSPTGGCRTECCTLAALMPQRRHVSPSVPRRWSVTRDGRRAPRACRTPAGPQRSTRRRGRLPPSPRRAQRSGWCWGEPPAARAFRTSCR